MEKMIEVIRHYTNKVAYSKGVEYNTVFVMLNDLFINFLRTRTWTTKTCTLIATMFRRELKAKDRLISYRNQMRDFYQEVRHLLSEILC